MFLYSNVMAHKQTINDALLSFFLDATEAIGDEEMGGNGARGEKEKEVGGKKKGKLHKSTENTIRRSKGVRGTK